MSVGGKIVKVGVRVLVCAGLLGWIFHAIFSQEARQMAAGQGLVWEQMSRAEQWQAAWHYGPLGRRY